MCHLGFFGSAPVAAAAPIGSSRTSELATLRRVRDQLDRDYLRPLNVEALARAAGIPARPLTSRFEIAYGRSPYSYLVARRAGSTMLSTLPVLSLRHCTRSQEKEGS